MRQVPFRCRLQLQGKELSRHGSPGQVGDRGEVPIRDAKLLVAYLDNPQATRAMSDGDGWLDSGDALPMSATGKVIKYALRGLL
jgi:long-subunit acyl-CoA synthetase (AMP-forming)